MKINCITCGHKVDLDDAYDDYQGPIRCLVCSTMLEIMTQEGRLRSVRFANASSSPSNEEASESAL
jgi:hypothetical protein